ncbi:MAG: hypothetical protein WCH11_06140 [Bdellovibrio sp.]
MNFRILGNKSQRMFWVLFFLILFPFVSRASDLTRSSEAQNWSQFLKSCGYGTLIGAGLGAASLAFVEDPGSKLSNLARGASLGLYIGIGVGAYLWNTPSESGKAWLLWQPGGSLQLLVRF